MRFPSPVAMVVFALIVGLVGSVEGKGGKGGGGGRAHARWGGGGGNMYRGGGGGSKFQSAQSKQAGKPHNDKVVTDRATKEKVAHDKATKEKVARDKHGDVAEPADETNEPGATYNKKEKQLANFQRQRDKKLTQAEHLREIAERNGNANLAANADRMEAQAYEQYARKVSHLEKFGVTDPALDLDGDGFADPYSPLVDPLNDPLSEEMLSELIEIP